MQFATIKCQGLKSSVDSALSSCDWGVAGDATVFLKKPANDNFFGKLRVHPPGCLVASLLFAPEQLCQGGFCQLRETSTS